MLDLQDGTERQQQKRSRSFCYLLTHKVPAMLDWTSTPVGGASIYSDGGMMPEHLLRKFELFFFFLSFNPLEKKVSASIK